MTIQNNQQFFEYKATLEIKFEGVDCIFQLGLDPFGPDNPSYIGKNTNMNLKKNIHPNTIFIEIFSRWC